MDFFRIICIVFAGVLLAIQLKSIGTPIWIYLSIGLSIFILIYAVNRLSFVMDFIHNVLGDIGLESGYFEILFKIVGISYLCEFTSNICRESGFVSIASQLETGGKLTMMVLSLPILMAIVEMITGVL
ncbi:MAG: SpoIIIAC/SpoIIIAD family protein [Eubacteriales bacterium]|nr:SpoIIIAC/SpoIIIAD family protein [Eubacteriales bacterium]